ncbi:conjugal transfer protein TraI [Mucilaginibacter sp. BJC16-A38]|uniref:conjugal transfer protein TraI n=1 Tax=Mucilaginibacter phenanthrenivorans TaxID=1234842 RepID=UPI002158846D|nr:conjugal transfer protein TraI [Mucilaginibacter phenanthrenivorans]MCR8561940.1 conjugal transfer protein TraI [Mucilaginibacter phenanthrenivorans]
MKKIKLILPVMILFLVMSIHPQQAKAQFVIGDIIKLTVTKVIKAIDLKVQRMQNQTIWLQNAQKALENELSKLKLSEISSWSGQQRQLFGSYYDELWKIKSTIAYYQRIKDLTVKQVALVSEYQQAWSLMKQDRHFSAAELVQMESVYTGILTASAKNLDQIMMIISSNQTQMSDEQRLELISRAGDKLDDNYSDMRRYNTENEMLSLQRSKDLGDTQTTKALYGIN